MHASLCCSSPRESAAGGCVLLLSIGNKGSILGHMYCAARGEILRPMQDEPWRRRLTSVGSSIKNESMGIEDDQIPS
jgi:hypothetical protein